MYRLLYEACAYAHTRTERGELQDEVCTVVLNHGGGVFCISHIKGFSGRPPACHSHRGRSKLGGLFILITLLLAARKMHLLRAQKRALALALLMRGRRGCGCVRPSCPESSWGNSASVSTATGSRSIFGSVGSSLTVSRGDLDPGSHESKQITGANLSNRVFGNLSAIAKSR